MEARPIWKPRGRRLVQFLFHATHKRWLQRAQDNLEAVTLTYSRNDTRRGKGNRGRVLGVGNVAAAPIGVLATDGVAPEPKNIPPRSILAAHLALRCASQSQSLSSLVLGSTPRAMMAHAEARRNVFLVVRTEAMRRRNPPCSRPRFTQRCRYSFPPPEKLAASGRPP
jgi:hypothetical protein